MSFDKALYMNQRESIPWYVKTEVIDYMFLKSVEAKVESNDYVGYSSLQNYIKRDFERKNVL